MRDIMTGAANINPLTSKSRAKQFDLMNGYAQWLDVVEEVIHA
ncbi:hypothetical protein SAMN04487996_1412 [Dyadobacter soli]|uniref:Uncharacterized protein n=1 Tax=Dyadobacter soli TaxID=659014 RepID=A0A1G8CYQ4_9BACT|nr:hypothetical protein SAMN04487996_1412 [Dyadobacter soli]